MTNHAAKHPYHLVNPSPWPALGALAALAAGLGNRFGLWDYRFGFQLLRGAAWAGLAGALGCIAAAVWAVRARSLGALLGALLGVAAGGGAFGVPWAMIERAQAAPPIHDITTDTANPPQFVALAAARRASCCARRAARCVPTPQLRCDSGRRNVCTGAAMTVHVSRRPPASVAEPVRVAVPEVLALRYKTAGSTQGAFGQILVELSRIPGLGERLVTAAPDAIDGTTVIADPPDATAIYYEIGTENGWGLMLVDDTGTPRWLLRRMIRGRLAFRLARRFSRPLLPLIVFNGALIVTRLPVVVDTLAASQLWSFVLDLAVIASGFVLWWPALAPLPDLQPMSYGMRVGYLGLNLFLPTVPASFFTFSDYPIYSIYELAPRVHGISAVVDQRIAGLTMKVLGGAILVTAMSVMFFRWYHQETDADRGAEAVRSDPAAGA